MASNQKPKNNQKTYTKNQSSKKEIIKNNNSPKKVVNSKDNFIMKVLVFLGVIIFSFIIIYLMYHFFVEKSDIKINMSTDKQIEYITLEGQKEMIMTQKFISDLSYSMRYDVKEFKVFKYKQQDIYKNLNDERVLVVVEKSMLPQNCPRISSQTEYNNCYLKIDDYTEYHYISTNRRVYKITIKTPGTVEYKEGIRTRIDFMLNSFEIND